MPVSFAGFLSSREVGVEFRFTREDRDAGKRLDDFEDFGDLRLHVDERCLAAAFFELFADDRKHPESGAADKFQLAQIKHEIFAAACQYRADFALQIGGRGGVEAADEFYGDGPGVLGADILQDLDFEWHVRGSDSVICRRWWRIQDFSQ